MSSASEAVLSDVMGNSSVDVNTCQVCEHYNRCDVDGSLISKSNLIMDKGCYNKEAIDSGTLSYSNQLKATVQSGHNSQQNGHNKGEMQLEKNQTVYKDEDVTMETTDENFGTYLNCNGRNGVLDRIQSSEHDRHIKEITSAQAVCHVGGEKESAFVQGEKCHEITENSSIGTSPPTQYTNTDQLISDMQSLDVLKQEMDNITDVRPNHDMNTGEVYEDADHVVNGPLYESDSESGIGTDAVSGWSVTSDNGEALSWSNSTPLAGIDEKIGTLQHYVEEGMHDTYQHEKHCNKLGDFSFTEAYTPPDNLTHTSEACNSSTLSFVSYQEGSDHNSYEPASREPVLHSQSDTDNILIQLHNKNNHNVHIHVCNSHMSGEGGLADDKTHCEVTDNTESSQEQKTGVTVNHSDKHYQTGTLKSACLMSSLLIALIAIYISFVHIY